MATVKKTNPDPKPEKTDELYDVPVPGSVKDEQTGKYKLP